MARTFATPEVASLPLERVNSITLMREAIDPALASATLLILAGILNSKPSPGDLVLAALTFLLQFPSRLPFRDISRATIDRLLSAWLRTLLCLWVLGLVTGLSQAFQPVLLCIWAITVPALQISTHRVSPWLVRQFVTRRPPVRAVIVGTDAVGRAFARSLIADPLSHIKVMAFFDDRKIERIQDGAGFPIVGRLAEVGEYCRHHKIDRIYIALPMSAQPRIVKMLQDLRNTTASVWFVNDVYCFDPVQPRFETQYGFPVVAVYDSPFVGLPGALKRFGDIVFALVALTLAAPLMALIALAIRIDSRGPILFRQKRFGLDGAEIEVWKFRSMTVTEDGAQNYQQVRPGDQRITRIGAIIRKTSLDELPQFINVLQGRMSIVGPRPHVHAVNERYRQLIPGYMLRHKVRPGITGWAQIHGLRGGDDLESMSRRIDFDLFYLKNWSLALDFEIMARTIHVLLGDRHAY
jgi:putative colanic acid biosynthesis UDP-glucose lipid carrier transferase